MVAVAPLWQVASSKFLVPEPGGLEIVRARLIQTVQQGLTKRVSMITAGPGYGKTTLAASVARQCNAPVLWLQLDPRDRLAASLAGHLGYGIFHYLNGGDKAWTAYQKCDGELTVERMLTFLLDDLELVSNAVIFLDDAHLLEEESGGANVLSGLIRYAPAGVRFCLVGRKKPSLDLTRWGLANEILEVTSEALCFNHQELVDLVAGHANTSVAVDELLSTTEGWPAGATLLITAAARRVFGSESRSPRELFDYLSEEVFSKLEPELQEFALQTWVLGTMAASVCDSFLDRTDSEMMLATLLEHGAFLKRVGDSEYRYHSLFQEFLRSKLVSKHGDKQLRNLMKRAGDFYTNAGRLDQAIRCYLEARQFPLAAQAIERLAPLWFRTERLSELRPWLAAMPVSVVQQHPWLALSAARLASADGRWEEALGLALAARNTLRAAGDIRGEIAALVQIAWYQGSTGRFDAMREYLNEAEKLLTPEMQYETACVEEQMGVLYDRLGDSVHAEAKLRSALTRFHEVGGLVDQVRASELLGLVLAVREKWLEAVPVMQRAAELMRQLGEPSFEIGVNLAYGYLNVGEFERARAILEPMVEMSKRKIRRAYAAWNLMFVYTCIGKFDNALNLSTVAIQLAKELQLETLVAYLYSDCARIYRLLNQHEVAAEYLEKASDVLRRLGEPQKVKLILERAYLLFLNDQPETPLEKKEDGPYTNMLVGYLNGVGGLRARARASQRPLHELQVGLADCRTHQYEHFVLHHWHLGLAVVVCGLAFDLDRPYCEKLLALMAERLPESVRQAGIAMHPKDAMRLPAAWTAASPTARRHLESLLPPDLRRRLVGLQAGPQPVKMRLLGGLQLRVGERRIMPSEIEKRRAAELLLYLLLHDEPVRREEVVEALWPDLTPSSASTSLRVAVHHLRRLLEPHLTWRQRSRFLETTGGRIGFVRAPEIDIDLDRFRSAAEAGRTALKASQREQAAAQLAEACHAYGGELGAGLPSSPWLDAARERMRRQFCWAATRLGSLRWREERDQAAALELFQAAVDADPCYEPAYRNAMRLLLATGRAAEVERHYRACAAALARGLDALPSPRTRTLYNRALDVLRESAADAG